jgi:hypothetical protein
MANSLTMQTVLALGLALLCAAGPATAQNCGCPPGYCCSQFGYCGTTIDYCGSNTCNGNNPAQMNARMGYYKQYCQQFGVDPGNNLTCYKCWVHACVLGSISITNS